MDRDTPARDAEGPDATLSRVNFELSTVGSDLEGLGHLVADWSDHVALESIEACVVAFIWREMLRLGTQCTELASDLDRARRAQHPPAARIRPATSGARRATIVA